MRAYGSLSDDRLWPCFAQASFLMVIAARHMSAAENIIIEIYTSAADEADQAAGSDQASAADRESRAHGPTLPPRGGG